MLKRLLSFCAMAVVSLLSMAAVVEDFRKDWSEETGYPYYKVDDKATYEIVDGALKVTYPRNEDGSSAWSQYFIGDWMNLTEGYTYTIKFMAKAQTACTVDVLLGSWGSTGKAAGVAIGTEWAEVSCTVKDGVPTSSSNDLHVLIQGGLDAIEYKWVTVSHDDSEEVVKDPEPEPWVCPAGEIDFTTLPQVGNLAANNLGKKVGGGTPVYGNQSNGDDYTDVSAYEFVKIYGTPGLALRIFVNRKGGEGITVGKSEQQISIAENGCAVLDVKAVMAANESDHCYISCFKTNWGDGGRVDGITVVPAAALPELTINSNYNEDNSVWTATVEPLTEGNSLLYTIEGDVDEPEFMAVEGTITLAWTSDAADEFGICKYVVVVNEIDEGNIVAQGVEEVSLAKPLAKIDVVVNTNDDESQCKLFAYPTEAGNMILYAWEENPEDDSFEGEVPETGLQLAWNQSNVDEFGKTKYVVYLFEVSDKGEIVSTAVEEIILSEPIDIPALAGESEENPIVLTDSWNQIARAELGMDEANVTYFSYTAEHAGQFVFSCNPGKIANCTLDVFEGYMGMGTGYGKVVEKGETVTFSAILPAVYTGAEDDDDELYDVETYYITAEVQPLEVVEPAKPEIAFSALNADNETIYYLYNVEAGAFFISANDWSTRASVAEDFGFEFKIEANGDDQYILHDNVQARYGAQGPRNLGWKVVFAENPTSIYVDRDNQPNWDNWTITDLGNNTYTIGNKAVAGLLGLKAGQNIGDDSRLYFVEEGATTWAFVSEADYAKYWEAADDYLAYKKIEAAKEKVFAMANELNSTNVYTAEAKAAFDEKYPINRWVDEATYNTLAVEECEAISNAYSNNFIVGEWHHANDIDDVLLSAWTIGGKQCKEFDTPLYINTWSGEGENDGSDFKVPFFEYWTGDADKLGDNTMTATVTGLIPGATYTASAWTRVRMTNGVTDPAQGISFKVGDSEAVAFSGDQVGTSQFYIANIMSSGKADAEGNLTISFVVEGANVSWLSWKNVYYSLASLPEIAADFEYNEGGTQATVTTDYTPAEGNMLVAYVNYDYSEPYGMFEDGKVVVAPTPADFIGAAAHLVVTIREVKYDEAADEFVAVAEGQVELDFAREVPAMTGDSAEDPIVLATGWSEPIAKDAIGTDEAGYTHFKYTAEADGTFVFSCGFPATFCDEDGMEEVESTEVRAAYGKAVKAGDVVEFSAYLPGAWWNEDTETMVSIDELMFYANVTPAEGDLLINGDAEGEYGDVPCVVAKVNYGENDGKILPAEIKNVYGNNEFVVAAGAKVSDAWDNQLWIQAPKALEAGETYTISFICKADKKASVATQAHGEPGNYHHWMCLGNVEFDTEWKQFTKVITVGDDWTDNNGCCHGFKSIAFNLNDFADANTYYLDQVQWLVGEQEVEPAEMPWDPQLASQAEAELTQSMFCRYDGFGAEANVTQVGVGACDWGVSTGLPYGNGNVEGSTYADLTGWNYLVLEVTEGTPRLLLNRQGMDNSGDFIEINNPSSPYVDAVCDGVWYINLAKITAEAGYTHLNCIKGANWANTTIVSAKLYADPDSPVVGIAAPAIAVKPAGIYTIGGQKVETLQKGINIVIDENGNAKKVVVK